MSELIERLRSNQALPLCPFEKRSPEYFTTPNDQPCKFCGGLPEGPDKCTGADMRIMGEAADALAVKDAALAKINDIRNSIIGCQAVNWSEHIYPLVAALEEAGIEGMEYPAARANVGTLLERAVSAEVALAAKDAEIARLREALKPFIHQMQREFPVEWPDSMDLANLNDSRWHLKVGDFRRAARAARKEQADV